MNRGSRARPPASAAAALCKSDLLQALFGTSLVLVGVRIMCWTPLQACAASPPSSSSSSAMVTEVERSVNRTVRCLPVAHDVLWKRLRLVVADFDNFRTTADNNNNDDQLPLEAVNLSVSGNTDKASEPHARSAGDDDDRHVVVERKTITAAPDIPSVHTDRKQPDMLPKTLHPSEESNQIPDDASSLHAANGPSHDGDLHPRLDRLLRERKVRRRLRRNQRIHRHRKLMTSIFRKTSWHCHMTKYWKRMPAGIFPPYVQTARCRQRTCMLGMFECRPRRYRIKLLRKNDGVCNPLPTVATLHTDYEETWSFVEYRVVVGCECSRKHEPGSYSRHDRKPANTSRSRSLEKANS